MRRNLSKKKEPSDVMPKCPNCKEEIDQLDNIVSGITVYKLSLDTNREADYERDDFYPDNKENRWECHECEKTVATSEESALKFLKGE